VHRNSHLSVTHPHRRRVTPRLPISLPPSSGCGGESNRLDRLDLVPLAKPTVRWSESDSKAVSVHHTQKGNNSVRESQKVALAALFQMILTPSSTLCQCKEAVPALKGLAEKVLKQTEKTGWNGCCAKGRGKTWTQFK